MGHIWSLQAGVIEDFAITKLGELIELAANLRTRWIESNSMTAHGVVERRLGPL